LKKLAYFFILLFYFRMNFQKCTTRVGLYDHVKLNDERTGKVLYMGGVKSAKGDWYGIALDDPLVGKNDGTVGNKRYFPCRENKGVFVRKERIVEVWPDKKPHKMTRREYKEDCSHHENQNFPLKNPSRVRKRSATLRRKMSNSATKPKTTLQISQDKRAVFEEKLSVVEKEPEETHSEFAKRISEHEQKTKEAERLLDAIKPGAWQQIEQLESNLKRAEKELLDLEQKNQKALEALSEIKKEL